MTTTLDHIAEPLRTLALPIADLTPDPTNVRTHSERNVEAIANSLKRFGQRKPIVVQRQGMIVRAGNGTVDAAKQIGWDTIAAVVIDEDAVEATAFAIADNRSAELAGWDHEALVQLLQELPDAESVGFTSQELDDLLTLVNGQDTGRELDDIERDLWPRVSFILSPEVHRAWEAHVAKHDGNHDDAMRVLLQREATA
jgi:hypothetical protein